MRDYQLTADNLYRSLIPFADKFPDCYFGKIHILLNKINPMETAFLTDDLPNGYLYNLASDELNDALWCDQQIIKMLRAIAKSANGLDLRTECEDHAIQMELQLERLDKVLKMTGVNIKTMENKAMEALLSQVLETIETFRGTESLDTVLISAAQKVGRLRVGIYQSASTYLGLMEFVRAEMLLSETCNEEDKAIEKLLDIAYTKLLPLFEFPPEKKGLLAAFKDFFN